MQNKIIIGLISLILGASLTHLYHISMNSMENMDHSNMNMSHGENSMNMNDMTMNDMVSMMRGKSGEELEKEFLLGMIPHHEGAVEMAKILLQDKTISPEIKSFAENIIKAQDTEIKMMQGWLETKYK
jgi:uncharacterized protein (DUF305 family)